MPSSIVARDPDGRTVGAATASCYLAVGSAVPAVAAGVGALVTHEPRVLSAAPLLVAAGAGTLTLSRQAGRTRARASARGSPFTAFAPCATTRPAAAVQGPSARCRAECAMVAVRAVSTHFAPLAPSGAGDRTTQARPG